MEEYRQIDVDKFHLSSSVVIFVLSRSCFVCHELFVGGQGVVWNEITSLLLIASLWGICGFGSLDINEMTCGVLCNFDKC